jgi:hypothetical protein
MMRFWGFQVKEATFVKQRKFAKKSQKLKKTKHATVNWLWGASQMQHSYHAWRHQGWYTWRGAHYDCFVSDTNPWGFAAGVMTSVFSVSVATAVVAATIVAAWLFSFPGDVIFLLVIVDHPSGQRIPAVILVVSFVVMLASRWRWRWSLPPTLPASWAITVWPIIFRVVMSRRRVASWWRLSSPFMSVMIGISAGRPLSATWTRHRCREEIPHFAE